MFESNMITVVIDPEVDNKAVVSKAISRARKPCEARVCLFGVCSLSRRWVFLRPSCRQNPA